LRTFFGFAVLVATIVTLATMLGVSLMNKLWRLAPWLLVFLLGALFALAVLGLFQQCTLNPPIEATHTGDPR
jgi:purine-cytosine permease-like protein